MNREDIVHLATLARIELSEAELLAFESELNSIMSYISAITDMTASDTDAPPELGPVHNVFRADEVTTGVGEYTDVLLAEMPHTQGKFLKVKKILGATE